MTAVAGDRSEELAELIADDYARAVTGDADLAWLEEPANGGPSSTRRSTHCCSPGRSPAVDTRWTAPSSSTGRRSRWRPRRPTAPPPWRPPATTTRRRSTVTRPWARTGGRSSCSATIRAADGDRGRICKKAAELVLARSGAFSSTQEPAMVDGLVLEGLSCASDPADVAWLRALWGAAAIWWRNTGGEVDSFEDRTRSLTAALDEARALALPDLEAFAREFLCEIHMARGSYERVAELSREVEVFDRISSPARRSLGLVETAIWARDVAGEPERGLDLGMRGYELAKDLSAHDLMHATGFVIPTLLQLGRWRELDPILDAHVAAFAEEADSTCELLHAGVLAGATRAALGGDAAQARELGDLAKPFVSTDPLVGRLRRLLARPAADRGGRPRRGTPARARSPRPPHPRGHACTPRSSLLRP